MHTVISAARWLLRRVFDGDDRGPCPAGTQLTITRGGTLDCREELVATWIRPTIHLEWHLVVIGGKVYSFGCDMRPIYVDVCRKFIASVNPK